ncbi:MAG: amidohydrolase family protein, partial [Verrucomicrobiota bacterium]
EMYPKTRVKQGGLTDRYLADYPNMFGDLSAGSGRNSIERDEEHAVAFLDRHQDKLLLGTDCSDSVGKGKECSGWRQIENIRRLVPEAAVRKKILSENAKRIIQLG